MSRKRANGDGIAPAGASKKRQREYQELIQEFDQEGRYPSREKEVAARIVNKQRREFGETVSAKSLKKSEAAPDRTLPIVDYDHKTIPQIVASASRLTSKQLQTLIDYEAAHRGRKTLLSKLKSLSDARSN